MSERERQQLALKGGMKSVSAIEGKGEPKIGREEFMAVARRFGLSPRALGAIEQTLAEEAWGEGPFLANYYSGLDESCVQAYERASREIFGVPYAIGVSSGTAALHSAFIAAGVGPGREVICPAIGFIATASAVVVAGGVPVFCDVDESLGMDPTKIEALINERTVALAPTHVMGAVCDMDPIMAIARRHGLKVVEDCAQACGGQYKGRWVGTIGDLGCFSISAYKIVGGGEGGLVLTSDERLWDRANAFAEAGGLWRPDRFAPPRYEGEIYCGLNYRMSELEAAVDEVQMRKMPATVERFRAVRRRIVGQLTPCREITPQRANDLQGEVGYTLRFFPETIELGERIAQALRAEGIECGMRGVSAAPDWHVYSHMYPVTLQTGHCEGAYPGEWPAYRERGGCAEYRRGMCPVADDLFDRMISITLNQWYAPADCDHIAEGLNKVLAAYATPDPAAKAWH